MKTDSSAKPIWIKTFGNNYSSFVLDKNGNSYLNPSFVNNAVFRADTFYSYGGEDIFLAKYNSNGVFQWVAHGGGKKDDFLNELYCNDAGDIAISGELDYADTIAANLPYEAFLGTDTLICQKHNASFLAEISCLAPIAGITVKGGDTIKGHNSILLSTARVQGYTYQWLLNGAVIPKADSNSIYANDSGTYRVIVTSAYCPFYDETKIYGAISGLKNIPAEQFGLNIYPNPVNGASFTAEFNLSAQEEGNITLYNTDGEIILEQQVTSQTGGMQKVILQPNSTLGNGVYFLRLTTTNDQASVPVVYNR